MERSDFLKLIAGLALTPAVAAKLSEMPDAANVIVEEYSKEAHIAIDFSAIEEMAKRSGLTPVEILEIYRETSTLLYYKTPEMGPDYQPVTVLPNQKK